jgi:hypothetical protein
MRSRLRGRLVLACAAASLLVLPLLAGCGSTPSGDDVKSGGTYYNGPMLPKGERGGKPGGGGGSGGAAPAQGAQPAKGGGASTK